MQPDKLRFLRYELISLLKRTDPETAPAWGRMNFQQMVEHLGFAVQLATGRIKAPEKFPGVSQERAFAFMMSEHPFRENVRNPMLPEEPIAPFRKTTEASINDLMEDLLLFFQFYKAHPGKKLSNPYFGELGFDEQVQFLYKHSLHHLRQFGIEPQVKTSESTNKATV